MFIYFLLGVALLFSGGLTSLSSLFDGTFADRHEHMKEFKISIGILSGIIFSGLLSILIFILTSI